MQNVERVISQDVLYTERYKMVAQYIVQVILKDSSMANIISLVIILKGEIKPMHTMNS